MEPTAGVFEQLERVANDPHPLGAIARELGPAELRAATEIHSRLEQRHDRYLGHLDEGFFSQLLDAVEMAACGVVTAQDMKLLADCEARLVRLREVRFPPSGG